VFNVDAIMSCILPYHATLLFSRFVQILNIANSKWSFLENLQHSGAVLPRSNLVEKCHSDFNILEFICDTTQQVIQQGIDHKTLVSFYAVTSIEYIDTASNSQLKDVYLKRLLSYVSNGIKSRDLDYQSASYMILTQLASKKALSVAIVDQCIKEIVLGIQKFNPDHALLTIVFLCQSQQVAKLNSTTFETLITLPNFTDKIKDFMKNYKLQNFLDAFVSSLVEKSFSDKNFELLEKYATEINLEHQITSIIYKLFKLYSEDQSIESFVKQLLWVLEKRYPRQVDEGVQASISNLNDEEQQLVLQFTRLTFRGTQHEIVDQVNTSLFLCLEHPDEKIRMLALKKLRDIAENQNLSPDTREFIGHSLLLRLSDENQTVLLTVLSFPNLLQIVDTSAFIPALIRKYTVCKPLRKQITSILLQDTIVGNQQLFDFILPLVLTDLFSGEISLAKVTPALVKSNHPLLKDLSTKGLAKGGQAFNAYLIQLVAKNVASDTDRLLPMLISMFEAKQAQHFVLFVLNALLAQTTDSATKLKLSARYIQLLRRFKPSSHYQAQLSNDFSKNLDIDLDHLKLYTYHNIVNNLPQTGALDFAILPEYLDNENYSVNYTFLTVKLFTIFIRDKDMSAFALHLSSLFSNVLKQDTIWFLSFFWCQSTTMFSEVIQNRCLQLASDVLELKKTLNYQMLVPSLLANLSMQNNEHTRRHALTCLEGIAKNKLAQVAPNPLLKQCGNKNYDIKNALRVIVRHKNEVTFNYHALLDLLEDSDMKNLVTFILESIVALPLPFARYSLLSLLRNVKSTVSVKIFSEYASQLLQQASNKVSSSTYLQLQALSRHLLGNAQSLFTHGFQLLLSILDYHNNAPTPSGQKFIPLLLFTDAITDGNYNKLTKKDRINLIKKIASVLLNTGEPDVTSALQGVLKQLRVEASIIIDLIPSINNLKNQTSEVMDESEDNSRDTVDELVNILEMVQIMEKIPDKDKLIGPLFDILAVFENESLDIQVERVDYAINMIFSALRVIAEFFSQLEDGQEKEKIRNQIEKKFNIDMIIRSLQKSRSTRIRGHAITLIGELAKLFPVQIMSHIVSVIRTMEHSLKERDSVIFQVIQKTALEIIPEVLNKGMDTIFVLQEFVKCYDYIPSEKRLSFYTALLKTTSRKKLHILVLLLLLRDITEKNRYDSEYYKFIHTLIYYFKVPKQLLCLINLTKVAHSVVIGSSSDNGVFNLSSDEYDEDQQTSLKEQIIQLNVTHFSDVDFLKSLIDYEQADATISQKYLSTLNELLVLIWCSSEERSASLESACSKVQQLLQGSSFTGLIKTLLRSKNIAVREKALQILNMQLADMTPQSNKLIKSNKDLFVDLLNTLRKILNSEKEEAGLKQGAIVGVELLLRRYGKDSPAVFIPFVPIILDIIDESHTQLSSSSALCLASLCAELQLNILEYLPAIVKVLVQLLQSTFQSAEKKSINKGLQQLQVTSLLAIDLLSQKLIRFMSPYLSSIIVTLLNPLLLQSKNKKIREKSSDVLLYLAVNVPSRLIMQPLFDSYESAIILGDASLKHLLSTIESAVDVVDLRTDSLTSQINTFLIQLFDFRRLHTADDIDSVEGSICSLYRAYIKKLNENMFRPFLLDIIEWGRESIKEVADKTSADYRKYTDDEDGSGAPDTNRLVIFYKLMNNTVDTLKSIFVPYYSLLLEYCATDLNTFNPTVSGSEAAAATIKSSDSKKRKRDELESSKPEIVLEAIHHEIILFIVNALGKAFTYDNEGFFMNDNSRYEQIANPIVDQLSNFTGDETGLTQSDERELARYNVRAAAIAACLGKLATVVAQTNWRSLQKQVLLKTQRTAAPIKIAAIDTLKSMYTSVGQEFVAMLPELLPYVAELLEDDDEDVVKNTQKLVQTIEDTCGEDLGRYLV
jgi:U3 small nucleolar RNA-associated protein 10